MSAHLLTRLFLPALFVSALVRADVEPTARELIDRHAKEKSAVWADGDKATFFFQGHFEQVTLVTSGETKQLHRLEGSDVWTLTLDRPELAQGVFSYALAPGTRGEPPFKPGNPLKFEVCAGRRRRPRP